MTLSSTSPVVVAGATGNTGSSVVKALLALEIPVRALVRNVTKASTVLPIDHPLLEIYPLDDITNLPALVTAYKGARGVYILMPNLLNGFVHLSIQLQAVNQAQVPQIVVLTSSIPSYEIKTPFSDIFQTCHEMIKTTFFKKSPLSSDVTTPQVTQWTIVQPDSFYQNNLLHIRSIKAMNTVMSTHGTRNGLRSIDVQDIGACVAQIFADGPEKHASKEYLLIGELDQVSTAVDQVNLISKAIQVENPQAKEIKFVTLPAKEWVDKVRSFVNAFDLRVIEESVPLLHEYTFKGQSDVETILGRKPILFETWVDANVKAFL